MSFQIELDKYERAYGRFLHKIQTAIQQTFAQEEEGQGLTQGDLARELNVDKSTISRRLNGSGNITIRSISDIFTAMGREPLSNFSADGLHCPYAVGGPTTTTTINVHILNQEMTPMVGQYLNPKNTKTSNFGCQYVRPDLAGTGSQFTSPRASNQLTTGRQRALGT